jgi:hypothetical protein
MAKREGIYGALALGWCAVMSFIFIVFIYKGILFNNTLGYLFWYFAGCIVAERIRSRVKYTNTYNHASTNFSRLGS